MFNVILSFIFSFLMFKGLNALWNKFFKKGGKKNGNNDVV